MKPSVQRVWPGLVCALALSAAVGCAESNAPGPASTPGTTPTSAPPAPDAAPVEDAAPAEDAGEADAGADAGADGGDELPRIRMGNLETTAETPAAPASVAAAPRKARGATAARRPARAPSAAKAPAASAQSAKEVSAMGTIRAHMREVEDCYGRVALKDPSIAGRVTMRWTLGRDGVPSAVAVVSDTLKDKSVGACIKEHARTWRFPAPAGGLGVVTYPFDLRVM